MARADLLQPIPHLVVLLTLVYTFGAFPSAMSLRLCPRPVIIIAAGLYYSLEHPSIALGARLHDAMERVRSAKGANRERVYT